jgi:hypothetical protein
MGSAHASRAVFRCRSPKNPLLESPRTPWRLRQLATGRVRPTGGHARRPHTAGRQCAPQIEDDPGYFLGVMPKAFSMAAGS